MQPHNDDVQWVNFLARELELQFIVPLPDGVVEMDAFDLEESESSERFNSEDILVLEYMLKKLS